MPAEDSSTTAKRQTEPRCLVPPTTKWYRPGQGFTCRQIMLPLLGIGVILLTLTGWTIVDVAGSNNHARIITQLVLVVVALALLVRALYFVRRSLLGPLTAVRYWVSRMHSADLSARMPDLPGGEFAELARDINELARVFQTLSLNMESEVQAHTQRLARKTRSLEFLYDVAASINESHDLNELLISLMHKVQDLVEASAVTLRTLDLEGRLQLVASAGIDEQYGEVQERMTLDECLRGEVIAEDHVMPAGNAVTSLMTNPSFAESTGFEMMSIPFPYRGQVLGVYHLFVERDKLAPRQDIRELLTSTGRHLGMAIEQARLGAGAERLRLMEERTRLAHELHDSLAQTLASLGLQIRVLDETLHQGDESVVWQQMEKIESSVDEANTELRELIARFRAPIARQGVVAAIERLAARFRKEEGIPIFLQNEWEEAGLLPDMQVDVVRIVQEALTNARKHSGAHAVRVMLRQEHGLYRILIEDDGIGFDEQRGFRNTGEHIGLAVMQERAQRLSGDLRVDSEPGEGTRVTLTFEYPMAAGSTDVFRKRALA